MCFFTSLNFFVEICVLPGLKKKNSFSISVNPHGIFRFVPELKLCGSIKDPNSHPREGQGNSEEEGDT